ncbi:hypothetical protein chiPu_0012046 [Chiloscyllium punctatum]|uniref:Uncharacterized protein n=1 Tax=Chiloscyllium punctatum TaxID=137246 RepID=A0A401ST75_CHIPU|nr:hypothetical protein [Chiloscyllium punctatum]
MKVARQSNVPKFHSMAPELHIDYNNRYKKVNQDPLGPVPRARPLWGHVLTCDLTAPRPHWGHRPGSDCGRASGFAPGAFPCLPEEEEKKIPENNLREKPGTPERNGGTERSQNRPDTRKLEVKDFALPVNDDTNPCGFFSLQEGRLPFLTPATQSSFFLHNQCE